MLKKVKLCAILLFFASFCLGLAACGNTMTQLEKPQNLKMDGRTLVWDENENATGYVVYIGSEEHETQTASYDCSALLYPEAYDIAVVAVGDRKNFKNSERALFRYRPEKILSRGNDTFGLTYTLLEDGSGYEVSRGDWAYNDKRLADTITISDYFCGLPVKKIAPYFLVDRTVANNFTTGAGCNILLTGVNFPKKLEIIGEYAFAGALFLRDAEIPETVTEIDKGAFSHTYLTELTIPSGVNSIEEGTFHYTHIKSLTIPEGVVSIGEEAFDHCDQLTEVVLPESLESIGEDAFSYCSSLTKINAPQSVKRLDSGCFYWCSSLRDIPVFHNLEYMGASVFSHSLWYEEQPDGILIYGDDICCDYKGKGSAVVDLVIPPQVKMITSLLSFTNLVSVTIPEDVWFIGGYFFANGFSLTDIKLPKKLTVIRTCTFSGCVSLTSIEIPDSVKRIEESAFERCVKLKQIVLPASLEVLEAKSLSDAALTEIFYKGTAEQWAAIENNDEGFPAEDATLYLYSENQPSSAGNYWHYVDGKPAVWGA